MTLSPLYGALCPLASRRATAASSLLTGLLAYWRCDEESGQRADVLGARHLAEYNTVGFGAGKIGNAAYIIRANSEVLGMAAASWPPSGASFEIARWAYITEALGSKYDIYALDGTGGLYSTAAAAARTFSVRSGATTKTATAAFSFNAWHLVFEGFDAAAGTVYTQVDAGALVQTSGAVYARMGAGTGYIGGVQSALHGCSGYFDEMAMWSRCLEPDERTELYNSGAGRTHPFS